MIQEVKTFLQEHDKTQSWLADTIGISDGQLSSYLNHKYTGDVQSLEEKLKNFMRNFIPTADKSQDDGFLLETKNTKMVNMILSLAVKNTRLSAIFGNPGFGKTTAIKAFIKSRPEAIYIKANNLDTTKVFLKRICDVLGIAHEVQNNEIFHAIVKELLRSNRFIVIDEAEWLKDKTLDVMRNIWSDSNTAVILCGTLKLKNNLKGTHGDLIYVDSRVFGRWTFEGLSDEDIKKVAKAHNIADHKTLKMYGKANFRYTTYLIEFARELANMNNSDEINAEMLKEASRMIG